MSLSGVRAKAAAAEKGQREVWESERGKGTSFMA